MVEEILELTHWKSMYYDSCSPNCNSIFKYQCLIKSRDFFISLVSLREWPAHPPWAASSRITPPHHLLVGAGEGFPLPIAQLGWCRAVLPFGAPRRRVFGLFMVAWQSMDVLVVVVHRGDAIWRCHYRECWPKVGKERKASFPLVGQPACSTYRTLAPWACSC